MKISKFLVVLFMVVAALMVFLGLFSKITTPSVVDSVVVSQEDGMESMLIGRKLKEDGHSSYAEKECGRGNVSLEDYQPVDPSPTAKASIRPGPIEHGTPLMPNVPVPLPPSPSPPKQGG